MKINVFVLIFCFLIISFGGCNSMNKELKAIEGKDGVFAIIETSKGSIILELFYKETPLTVTNFVGLAEGTLNATKGKPFYDGLKFHRVISIANGDSQNFMIQGGDPNGNGTGGPGYKFINEIVDKFDFANPGVLAMANAGPDTNGSQFFITIVPAIWLNGGYSIFGKVVNDESQKIVNKILQGDIIEKITIIRQGEDAKNFTATQDDFDKRNSEAKIARDEKIKLQMAEKIKIIEKKFPDFNKDDNGIYYKITKIGSGEKIGGKKNVSVEYKGYLLDGTVFDQSKGRKPLEFTTGIGQMISGFDIMVQDMKLSETRTIIIPPELAYGSSGAGGVIPGNAYILFDIELVKID